MNTNHPNPLRCASLVLLSLICAGFLIELDSSTPWPPADPGAFADWWERQGTAAAAITVLRIAGTTLAGWGIFIGTAGLLAAIRPSSLLHGVWRRVTPNSFRQVLAASAISLTLAAPTVAAASTQSSNAPIVLEDLGQDLEPTRFTPVLTDLGPLNVEMSAERPETTVMLPRSDTTASKIVERRTDPPEASAPPVSARPRSDSPIEQQTDSPVTSAPQQWTVTEGDHLWKIAMRTLRDQGYETEPTAVVTYWRQLINVNREILNGNPDLIYPGMVLALPPVQPQS